jgi:hypothetical protein
MGQCDSTMIAGGFVSQFFIDQIASKRRRLRPDRNYSVEDDVNEELYSLETEFEESYYINTQLQNVSDPDIDIFVTENGATPEQVQKFLKKALMEFEVYSQTNNLEYAVLKNNSTINITPKNMKIEQSNLYYVDYTTSKS